MAQNSVEYIQHHLQNLTYGKLDGKWQFAETAQQASDMGFMAIHVDTMAMSLLMGFIFLFLFRRVAVKANEGVPTGLQGFVEVVVEFVQNMVRDTFYGRSALIAPLALTVFMWILLMNSLKWIPIDVIPSLAAAAGVPYFKYVPTADPNATFGISIGVFFLIVFYSIKIKGTGGYIK